jgi:tRNA(Arg) A34 adenosine deaminase TadA
VADEEQGQALLASIATPWQTALQEGWAAFRAGNPPVGAVITGPDGAIVAAARNRRLAARTLAGALSQMQPLPGWRAAHG